MSAEEAQREPTMEEILASIRKIISEEDEPGGGGEEALDLQESEVVPEEDAPIEMEMDMAAAMEEEVAEEPVAPDEDLMFMEQEDEAPAEMDMEAAMAEAMEEPLPEPEPEIEPEPEMEMAVEPEPMPDLEPAPSASIPDDTIVGDAPAGQAAGALGRLMGTMMVSQGQTLDGVVRELLKPMLKEWLDANLPQLVESEVQKEIERIRRLAK